MSERDRPDKEKAPPKIEVTPEMIEAGVSELKEHCFGEDSSYVVECIFRAMAHSYCDRLAMAS